MAAIDFEDRELRTPTEWAQEEGMIVVDPVGWINRRIPFDAPITRAQYYELRMQSGVRPIVDTDVRHVNV